MSWLITGGSGQLGTALSRELAEYDYLFIAPNSQHLDITLGVHLLELIEDFSPKVIINCAAWTNVDTAESNELLATKANTIGAENVALAARQCKAKLIHMSTDYVFSGENTVPWKVDMNMNPQSVYGRTKAEGERRVLSIYAENAFIVRTAWLYSPWGKNFAKTMVRLALNSNDDVPVVNDQIGQPTSASDLAKQIVTLGDSSAPAGIYHGTNGGHASWFEFAQEIFKLVGANGERVIPTSSSQYPRPAKRPAYSVLDQSAWANTSVNPLRNWRIALKDAMPAIISAVEAEE